MASVSLGWETWLLCDRFRGGSPRRRPFTNNGSVYWRLTLCSAVLVHGSCKELLSDLTSPPSSYTKSSPTMCLVGRVDSPCQENTHHMLVKHSKYPKINKKDPDYAIRGPTKLTLGETELWLTMSCGPAGHWSLPCVTLSATPLGRPIPGA